MKKTFLKYLLHLLICVVFSFVCIYMLVFAGGWKLIESGDPILIEIAVSIVVGIVIWMFFEITRLMEAKIKSLEKRIEELEKNS